MPKRNITKFGLFVICVAAAAGTGCAPVSGDAHIASASKPVQAASFREPAVTGNIASDDLTETSGLTASKCQTGVYFAHNDSGDGPFVFALNETGATLGVFRVNGASNIDWEDISDAKDADGDCYLYIGDIGNNGLERNTLTVYVVPEPDIETAKGSTRKEPVTIDMEGRIDFSYPDNARRNAEALMVTPGSNDLYIVEKTKSGPASVFKLSSETDAASPRIAQKVGEISVPAVPNGLITGGDISPDGKSMVLCDYFAGYELDLPDNAASFDDIWKAKPLSFDIGKREIGEAVAFTADGSAVIATSEKKHPPLYKIERRTSDPGR